MDSSGNPLPDKRADWTPTANAYVVNLLLDLKSSGQWTDTGPRKCSWKPLLDALNRKFPSSQTTMTQLKNHVLDLKKCYRIVKTLLEQSGFGWDDSMHQVVAEDAVWDQHLVENKAARRFRKLSFPLYNELSKLYEGSGDNGEPIISNICAEPVEENILLLESKPGPSSQQPMDDTNEGSSSVKTGGNGQEDVDQSKHEPVTPPATVPKEGAQAIVDHRMALSNELLSNKRAEWTPARDAFVVKLLKDLKRSGQWTNTGPRKECWKPLLDALNRKYPSSETTMSQLKNHVFDLKKCYRIVKTLQEQEGFRWDDNLHLVVADDKAWERYLRANKAAKRFRKTSFPLFNELRDLYPGRGTEDKQIDNCLERVENKIIRVESKPDPSSQRQMDDTNEGSGSSKHGENNREDIDRSKRRSVTPLSTPHEKKVRHLLVDEFSKLAPATNEGNSALAHDPYAYDTCLDTLQDLEELDDEERIKAVDLLIDRHNAMAFMKLRGPLRIKWLRFKCNQVHSS